MRLITFSRSAVDQLGRRLRKDPLDPDDITLFSELGKELEREAMATTALLRNSYLPEFTPRPTKTLYSTRAKMARGSTALSQMQDIVGCRIVVDTSKEQEDALDEIERIFPKADIKDLTNREMGYRAFHVLLNRPPFNYEIQLRTELQNAWAQLSEKLADRLPEVKYGGGPPHIRVFLDSLSKEIADFERDETGHQMDFAGSPDFDTDPEGLKGDPELRQRRSAILTSLYKVERFLR